MQRNELLALGLNLILERALAIAVVKAGQPVGAWGAIIVLVDEATLARHRAFAGQAERRLQQLLGRVHTMSVVAFEQLLHRLAIGMGLVLELAQITVGEKLDRA